MNDLSQDAWFYAQNGSKGGPVGFSDLQRMAQDGKLHPRQDLIWAKGMDRWQAAGEIQGLFERRAPVEAALISPVVPPVIAPVSVETAEIVPEKLPSAMPTAAATVDRYEAAEELEAYDSVSEEVMMPGARRRSFLFFLIVFPVLWLALTAAAGTFMNGKMSQESLIMVVSGMVLLPMLVGLILGFMRLVNLGMSGWWILGSLVPFLNLWVGFRCFSCPAGYAIHKKMDGVGIFLAILYWLVMLAGIAGFGALVAIVVFNVGSEKLRDQIVDPIKQNIYRPAKP